MCVQAASRDAPTSAIATSSAIDSGTTGSRSSPGSERPQGPEQQPPNPGPSPGGGGGGGGASSQLLYWVLLLAEYGGVYGTAAVLIGWLAHVDVFGGLHWEPGAAAVGLALVAPVLAFDAAVGLPDWSGQRQGDSQALVRLFVDPALLPRPQGAPGGRRQQAGEAQRERGDSSGEGEGAAGPAPAGVDAAAPQPAGGAEAGQGSGAAPPSSALWAATQRLRLALMLMQESSVRNNPGARLTPGQEAVVILVACAAEEMLYRAVMLTLVGRWLRDRAFEAGVDDVVSVPYALLHPVAAALAAAGLAPEAGLPPGVPGVAAGTAAGAVGAAAAVAAAASGSGGTVQQMVQAVQVDTGVVAQWAALGLGCALGAAVFAARAWQETRVAQQLQLVQRGKQKQGGAVNDKVRRLMPGGPSAEELEAEREQMERLEVARAALASSVGVQGALVWTLEGAREVAQVAASGASFLLTGNLLAPLAGSVAAQLLVSGYQRLGLRRSLERRAAVVAQRRAQAARAASRLAAMRQQQQRERQQAAEQQGGQQGGQEGEQAGPEAEGAGPSDSAGAEVRRAEVQARTGPPRDGQEG